MTDKTEARKELANRIIADNHSMEREMLPRPIMLRICKKFNLDLAVAALGDIGVNAERDVKKHPVEHYLSNGEQNHGNWVQILRTMVHYNKRDAFRQIIEANGTTGIAFRFALQSRDIAQMWALREQDGGQEEWHEWHNYVINAVPYRSMTFRVYAPAMQTMNWQRAWDKIDGVLAVADEVLSYTGSKVVRMEAIIDNTNTEWVEGSKIVEHLDLFSPAVRGAIVDDCPKIRFVRQPGPKFKTVGGIGVQILIDAGAAIKEDTI